MAHVIESFSSKIWSLWAAQQVLSRLGFDLGQVYMTIWSNKAGATLRIPGQPDVEFPVVDATPEDRENLTREWQRFCPEVNGAKRKDPVVKAACDAALGAFMESGAHLTLVVILAERGLIKDPGPVDVENPDSGDAPARDNTPGKCCACGYDGEDETACSAREDGTHCRCWWEGAAE